MARRNKQLGALIVGLAFALGWMVVPGGRQDERALDAELKGPDVEDSTRLTGRMEGASRVHVEAPQVESGFVAERVASVVMDPQHALTFHVVDESGNAVSGARIELSAPLDEVRVQMTDESGRCAFVVQDSSAPERLEVVATKVGRVSASRRVSRWRTEVPLILAHEVEIFGVIEDAATGTGIAGATVLVLSGDPEPESVVTDSLGRFGPVQAPVGCKFGLIADASEYAETMEVCDAIEIDSVSTSPDYVLSLTKAVDATLFLHDARTMRPIVEASITPRSFVHRDAMIRSSATGIARVTGHISEESGGFVEVEAEGYCRVMVAIEAERALETIDVPMVREIAVEIRTATASGELVADVPIDVEFVREYESSSHGYFIMDASDLSWPSHVRWRRTPKRHDLRSDENGLVTIGNLPPGLFGLEIARYGEEDRAVRVEDFVEPGSRKSVVLVR